MKYLLIALLALLFVNPAKSQEIDVVGEYVLAEEFRSFVGTSYEFHKDGTFSYSYTRENCSGYTVYLTEGFWQKVDNLIVLKSVLPRSIESQSEIIRKDSKTETSSFKMTDENGKIVNRTYQIRLYHRDNPKEFTVFYTSNGV
jgi:hypothetical protein